MSEIVPYGNLAGFSGYDYLTAGTQPSEKGVAPAQRNTCRLWNQPGDPPWLGRGELVINDFSQQGLNHPDGDFSTNSNGLSRSDFVTLRTGELIPPPNTISLSDSAIASVVGFHTAYTLGTLFMGAGTTANHALYKETSAGDPTPVAITYPPTGSICSLTRILISAGERLLIGHVGAAAKIISTNIGTIETTMHTDTASLWGALLSPVNADGSKPGVPMLLLYSGTQIGYLSADATMTVAPTKTHTVPAGGIAIGIIKPAGRGQQAFWGIPRVSNASGALVNPGSYMDIYATPVDGGSDYLPVTLRSMPFGIKGAIPFRDGILMWDDTHVVYWDGNDDFDLGLFRRRLTGIFSNPADPLLNHDYVYVIKGVFTDGVTCGVVYQSYDNGGVGASQLTSTYCEMYNFETSSWNNAGASFTSPIADLGYLCNGSVMSPTGLRMWFLSDLSPEIIHGFFIPRAYESLLWQHSIGVGSVTTSPVMPTYLTTGTGLSPRWRIDQDPPGVVIGTRSIARSPKVIYETEFNGDLGQDYQSTISWSFVLQVQGFDVSGTLRTAYNQTFASYMPPAHYLRKNPATAWTNIVDIQLYFSATNSNSNVRALPKLLPFTIRFAYIKDMTWKEGGVTMYPPTAITPEVAPMLLGTQGQA